jgi:methionine biosynthesis protein MetW
VRWAHLWTGRAPKTGLFPHDWYDSPNIHFLTVFDFESLAHKQRWRIERRIFLAGGREVTVVPNLSAEVAVFLFSASP